MADVGRRLRRALAVERRDDEAHDVDAVNGWAAYSNAPTGSNPFQVAVAGDTVWVGDLDNPRVLRVNAVTRQQLPPVKLPGVLRENGRVFGVAAASGYVWAATPFARSLWKIDAKTNAVERIRMAYPPIGVTASGDDVSVTVGPFFGD